MRKAFLLTCYNRPEYLEPVLDSLMKVRGWKDWHVAFSIEPSDKFDEVYSLIEKARWPYFVQHTTVDIYTNHVRLGVLEHPFRAIDELFAQDYDYVLRWEDDIIAGQDVLEYHSWAAETFKDDPEVGIITAFAADNRSHAEAHRRIGLGSPLAIGTWKDRWDNVIRDTWDHDYSTGTTNDKGWDHNLHLRVFPERGLHAIIPNHTKVEHIGVFGEHSLPEIFFDQGRLDTNIPPQDYREVQE